MGGALQRHVTGVAVGDARSVGGGEVGRVRAGLVGENRSVRRFAVATRTRCRKPDAVQMAVGALRMHVVRVIRQRTVAVVIGIGVTDLTDPVVTGRIARAVNEIPSRAA